MRSDFRVLLLAVFVLMGGLGYAQNAKPIIQQKTQTDSIKRSAELTISIGDSILGGKIDRNVLLEHPFLTAKANDGVEWEVVSYLVTFVRQVNGNGVEDPPINVFGAEYTEQIKSLIKSLPSGTIMEFMNIRIESVAGAKMLVAPLIVRIK